MWKYAALLSYRGTKYCGWQRQKGSAAEGEPSIQATIEGVLRRMTEEDEVSITGSGRTDSGVHAVGQVGHFVLKRKEWDPEILKKGLNGLLPKDIQVMGVKPVALDFHAQRSADKKQYSYYFQQGPCALPHLMPYSLWIRKRMDLEAMREAVGYLVGEHDFKPFQARGAAPVKTTVRRILEASLTLDPVPFPGVQPLQENEFGLIRVRLVGTGFLKQMVRGISGTLLQIGEGRRPARCMREIIESGKRSEVGPTAPGRALWLEQVWYSQLNW